MLVIVIMNDDGDDENDIDDCHRGNNRKQSIYKYTKQTQMNNMRKHQYIY